jgi:hypothetical protein
VGYQTLLILYSIVFMNYWAGLNSTADQEIIGQGVEILANVARAVQNIERRGNLRIEDAGANQNANAEATGGVQEAAAGDDEAAYRF